MKNFKSFKKTLFTTLLVLAFLIIPSISFAQLGADDDIDAYNNFNNNTSSSSSSSAASGSCKELDGDSKIQDIFGYLGCVLNLYIIPLIISVGVLFFIYGVVKFMLNSENENEREKGKQFMIWGIIGLTVIVSVWGLVSLVGGSFGLDTSKAPQVTPN